MRECECMYIVPIIRPRENVTSKEQKMLFIRYFVIRNRYTRYMQSFSNLHSSVISVAEWTSLDIQKERASRVAVHILYVFASHCSSPECTCFSALTCLASNNYI